jgi:ribosome-associated protein
MSETSAKKDVQKLQRAIVDGLEDIKAIDVRVFDTGHLSPLFERVIVASGASNRQTKALAASVRDKVRAGGWPKPRTEGEENGEWIIVDCGPAVAHIMQPAIRQYYHLEEIWGEKPLRLKLGAPKPAPVKKAAPDKTAAAKPGSAQPARAPAKKAPAAKKSPAATKKAAPAKRAPARKTSSAKPAAKTAARPAAKPAAKTARKTAPRKSARP